MDLYIALQLTLVIISLTGLWVYYYAFNTGYNNHKQGIKSSVPKKLYYASTYPALIWYVLPFVKQPRIHGIYDWIDGDFNIPSSVYIIITLSVFVYFFIIVSPIAPLSIVVFAPISTSSSTITVPI